ncbi:cilia- and flagella-associated protein 251-like isoform X3 [Leptopilina heterotoma]|uniref:cilia- and flagella-associated protein 251-like isoform X3 n=1 Tax=Leptopilina heterotoma TaxID=63436 RepID=UPI001CA9F37F|nr:cilia- and flagella-associated protein 251-like isoform X3 [Leptopilina heterotoma]
MVYESDFYTTRRPYTRPIVSSYSVTTPYIIPISSNIQVRTIPYLPYVAHKRLVTIIHTPAHSYYTGSPLSPVTVRVNSRVRPSILAAELNRIRDRQRPSSVSYTEKYLNSRPNIEFDDEAREIRARADALLRRIHVFVPKPSPRRFFFVYFPSTRSDYIDENLRSDYIRRLLNTREHIRKDLEYLNLWYQTPECRNLGEGHLACVRYVGGRPQSKRRPYYKLADLTATDVRNDVNFLSYYRKNRLAADKSLPEVPMTERELRKARALETEWSIAQKEKETARIEEIRPEEEEEEEIEPVREKVKEKKEKKEKKDKKRKEEEAEIEDEEGRKKAEEEAIKRAEAFLAKRIEEARIQEEKRLKIEAEQKRLEDAAEAARLALIKAEEEARLAEIAEQERLEALRRAEEERMEEARLEAERLIEAERMYRDAVEAAAEDEEERLAKELAEENRNRRQDDEERLVAVTNAVPSLDEVKEYDDRTEDSYAHRNLSDHEKEENPDDPTVEDNTQVEEEGEEDIEHDGSEPIVDDFQGPESHHEMVETIEDSPQIEEVFSTRQESVEEQEDEDA